MKKLLLIAISLLTITACGNSEKDEAERAKLVQEVQKVKAEKEALLHELKTKEMALAQVTKEAKKAKLLAESLAKKETFKKAQNEKLSKIGIHVENNTITIDTNKTKDFFKQLGENFRNKIKKITQDLEKDAIEQKEAGIHINENNINIDFNKTKDFLEKWGKKMQGYVKEFDTVTKDIDGISKK